MSTQIIRNIVNTQIDSVLSRAKQELKNEGKKKLSELQSELPTPDDVISKLQTDKNTEACSERGLKKQDERYNKIINGLNQTQNVVKTALENLNNTEEKLKPITEEVGPIAEIRSFSELLKNTFIPILTIAILAVPLILAALTGPAGHAKAADAAQQRRDKADSKRKEFNAIIQSIPLIIEPYKKKALKLLAILIGIKLALVALDALISKLKLFAYAKVLETTDHCNDVNNTSNDSVGNTNNPIVPDPNGPTELETYMSFLNDNYKDVYDKLQSSNNEKAIERIVSLKENLEED